MYKPTSHQINTILPCAHNKECKQAGCETCREPRDVESHLRKMDTLYGASFTSWLKNEENVMVTASYLQRVCNEYCFPRILTAIRWLEKDWKPESTAWLIRHITMHWGTGNKCSTEKIDVARATFVQCLMENWTPTKISDFVPAFLELAYPANNQRRMFFLIALFDKLGFGELSELFSRMGNGLDYSTKVKLLQEAAKRECTKLGFKRRQEMTQVNQEIKKSKCQSPLNNNKDSSMNSLGLIINKNELNQEEKLSNQSHLSDQLVNLFDHSNNHNNNQLTNDFNTIHHRPLRLTRVNTEDHYLHNQLPTSSNNEFHSATTTSTTSTTNSILNNNINTLNTSTSMERNSRTCPGTPTMESFDERLNQFDSFYLETPNEIEPIENVNLASQELSGKIATRLL